VTVEGVAMSSLLAVTVAATASVTFHFTPVVAPCTALVAYGFWRVRRRVTPSGGIWLYCLGGGAVAGALNGWLTLCAWWIMAGEPIQRLDFDALAGAGVLGSVAGVAYGFGYLIPMFIELSARSLRRTDGIDRCLMGYGLWGVLILGVAFHLVLRAGGVRESMHVAVFLFAAATLVLHGSMALIGTLRWARRRWWLERVLQGKVADWLVCDSERFHATELAGLEVFCSPLFASPTADSLHVLAWADPTHAYRATPLTPKYLVR